MSSLYTVLNRHSLQYIFHNYLYLQSGMYEACPESKDTKVLNMYNIFNLQTRHWMNCLYITLFFNTVIGIVQTFIKSWNRLLYPPVIEVCHLPFEPRPDSLHFIIITWIQECGENPMFHLQSQWSPESHLFPVSSAWETSARKPSVSFCDRSLTFWVRIVRTIFCILSFLSQLHELWS